MAAIVSHHEDTHLVGRDAKKDMKGEPPKISTADISLREMKLRRTLSEVRQPAREFTPKGVP